jgi:hypothetical protein
MAVEVARRILLAQTARRGPAKDGASVRPLVETAHARVPLGLVLADADCDRARHPPHIRRALQAPSVRPAQRGGATWPMPGVRARMRQDVPVVLSRQRALIESLISAAKRKLSARAPGRSRQRPCVQA